MNLLQRVFGPWKAFPDTPGEVTRPTTGKPRVPPHIQTLIDELTAIGNTDGFLSQNAGGAFDEDRQHRRAREIGEKLHARGGAKLMRRVMDLVDCPTAHHLTAVWHDIGDFK